MIGIKDLYTRIIRRDLPEGRNIICEYIDPAMAVLNRLLDDALSYFSFTLVVKGEAVVNHTGTTLTLRPNDLMITTPGAKVYTLEVSDDYSALCLMADETDTYEITGTLHTSLSSFSPLLIHSPNKLKLNSRASEVLRKWMKEIVEYGRSQTKFTSVCLDALYSLFVCELMDIENVQNPDTVSTGRPSEIFMDFLQLLPKNYIRHHDIQFYADRLAVTSIYLSRIVKRYSGQTVRDHIDRLLMSEASMLLRRTDKPIADIAESLNFANPQSFCKFFTRYKSISPRVYRNAKSNIL